MNDTETPSGRRFLTSLCTGFFTATTLIATAISWTLVSGLSQPASTALLIAIAVGVTLATWRRVVSETVEFISAVLVATLLLSMAPRLLDGLLSVGASISGVVPLVAFLPAAIVPAITATLLTRVLLNSGFHDRSTKTRLVAVDGWIVLGAACGCLGMLAHGQLNLPLPALPMISGMLLLTARLISPSTKFEAQPAGETTTSFWTTAIRFAVSGMLLASTTDFLSNFFPLSGDVLCAGLAVLLTGAGLWLLFASQPSANVWSAGIPVLAIGTLPWLVDVLIAWNLTWNATQSAWMTIACRAILFGCAALVSLVPLLTAWPRSSAVNVARSGALALLLFAFCWMSLSIGSGLPVMLAAVTVIALTFIPSANVALERRRWPIVGTLVAACLLAVVGANDLTARTGILFSGRAAAARQAGLDVDMIRQSDSRRLLNSAMTSHGRIGFWRTIGDQLELRRDGFPVSYVTTNVHTSPQTAADALATIIPLVLHPSPSYVVLIGDEAAVGLHACSNFPLLKVDAIRSDQSTTAAVRSHIWQHAPQDPFADERIRVAHEPVSLQLRRIKQSAVDVLVADSGGANRPAAQLQFTNEFYRLVRTRLASDGVFCQRLPRYDLGSKPVLQLIAAAKSQFKRVSVMRLEAGELALLAGGPDLVRTGLFQRLQKPQVQQQLTRCGWDWSQLAALPIVDSADPVGLLEHTELPFAPSVLNANFAFSMTAETLRPADKNAEIRAAFAPHQRRLADVPPRTEGYAEFARRYAAVIQQNEILTAFPDQPWPYRTSLKSEMQRNPRPPLEVVREDKITKVAHPADQHRKSYFTTLGEAIQQARDGFVHPGTLRKLTDFTATYEPLLSYFAHHELIRIHEHTGHPSPALELRHRMHTVYFTNADDLSVRGITQTMEQLMDDPELLPTAEMRFDHLNSLLQELVRRWDARRGHSPRSARETQRDVEKCIHVANAALDKLEKWSDAVQVAKNDVRLRRRFVNRSLIAPLRDYQQQVVKHRLAHDVPIETAVADDELPILSGQSDLLSTN